MMSTPVLKTDATPKPLLGSNDVDDEIQELDHYALKKKLHFTLHPLLHLRIYLSKPSVDLSEQFWSHDNPRWRYPVYQVRFYIPGIYTPMASPRF
jgi:hypothetical protein